MSDSANAAFSIELSTDHLHEDSSQNSRIRELGILQLAFQETGTLFICSQKGLPKPRAKHKAVSICASLHYMQASALFVVLLYFQCQSCERVQRIHNTLETFIPHTCLQFVATVLLWNHAKMVNLNNAVHGGLN